ncbi:S-layer homology domain-containing protein [Oceanobacillus halophilus]|uniref:S-layer homology domain-containing protein n=1 Tax=Oceanobacillus halophilus TaxID=930130 RepID=A0A495A2C2_9BACI|nr:S-layer homology domain-containing protein [Oceanobacillus halophilus]RKQ33561.1 S-layer homology domain-containing protein [Oceanobacillus halophilus]
MSESWLFIIDFLLLSLLVVTAAVLKARIPFLTRWIIPTSMIAGFLGLIFGTELIGWIHFDLDILGELVYHLMAIGFIALSLKERDVKNSPNFLNAGMLIVSTYLIQGIVGFSFFLLLIQFFFPEFFPGIGLLLPLGFGQGPGQAYSIGTQWEQLGINSGGNIGLTIAGLGFIWATVIGIILINILVKNKRFQSSDQDSALHHEDVIETSDPDEIPLADAIDKLTYQIALIGTIYLITYLTLIGLENILTPLGTFGETLAQLLLGFHFIIGSLYAMAFRIILNRLKDKGFKLEHEPNNFLLQRISGFAFDYMIAASIAAISIHALQDYLIPIILLTTIGGFVTILFMVWVVPRLFPNDKLPNTLGFYGMATGTISTGMALVKAVDPQFKSNTTENLVMGSASAIIFGFPLLLLLNVPVVGYIENKPILYIYTLIGLIIYFLGLMTILHFRSKKAI